MPDIEGKLTLEDRQSIESRLGNKMKMNACPICTSRKWTLMDTVITPTTLRAGGGLSTGDPVFPQVMFVSECGYTRYFSCTTLGLVF
jgi:hypothetical protein